MLQSRRAFRWALALVAAAAIIVLAPGYYRSLLADRDDAYQGLRIFSDVLDIVQKKLCR